MLTANQLNINETFLFANGSEVWKVTDIIMYEGMLGVLAQVVGYKNQHYNSSFVFPIGKKDIFISDGNSIFPQEFFLTQDFFIPSESITEEDKKHEKSKPWETFAQILKSMSENRQ